MHPSRTQLGVFDLLVVTKGALHMGEDGRQWEVGAGQALMMKPDRHQYPLRGCDLETHFYWLHVQTLGAWSELVGDEWLEHPSRAEPFKEKRDERLNMKLFTMQFPQYARLARPEEAYMLIRQLLSMEIQPHALARWRQQELFQRLLAELQLVTENNSKPNSARIAEQAAEYVQLNYKQVLSYKQIQAALSFDPTYISRCMKRTFGVTFSEYLIRYRLDQAASLLLKTDLPIFCIAEEVGFHNHSYFARAFLKLKGCSPSTYRERYARKV
jgi:YesN/AraC family two-component response regulator